jgi:hypothetical protein
MLDGMEPCTRADDHAAGARRAHALGRALFALVAWLAIVGAGRVAEGAEPADRPPNPAKGKPGELTQSDRIAIRAVIENQISAFRRDDEATAFSFAAPNIQAKFGSPENFARMVRETYPAVYRAQKVRFDGLVVLGGEPTQRAMLVGPDGVPVTAFYVMERQEDGLWKVKGCVLAAAERQPA